VHVRLEPSGSQIAVRKVTESGMRADVVAVADAELIEKMMIPQHASWTLEFATNELVLAHLQHSQFTDEITAQHWPEILLRGGVRLGRVDPDTAPLGYHTIFGWQLAERSGLYGAAGEGLTAKLLAAVPASQLAVDETELLSRLEAKAVDYAFLYRSTAEDHRLKMVVLPPEVNLGHRDLEAKYGAAELEVRMKQGGGKSVLRAHPITYGLTIPTGAPHAEEAEKLIAFLIGPRGQALQRAAGFSPLAPALSRSRGRLGATLRPLVEAPPDTP
jgi:molybdate/tungstate transport system substrate-binding protein